MNIELEFIKQSRDPIRFIEKNRFGFNSQTHKDEILKLFNFERDIVTHINNSKFSIINKSRQQHLDSIVIAYLLHYIIYNQNKNTLIVVPKLDVGIRFLERLKTMLFNMKDRPEIVINNKKKLKLDNGCLVNVEAASSNAGRGYNTDFLIVPEAAYIKDLYHIWLSVEMMLSAKEDSKCIIYSTPYYDDGFFSDIWGKSIENPFDNFNPITVHWSQNPFCNVGIHTILDKDGNQKLTSPWYEEQCLTFGGNEDMIKRELDLGFISKKLTKQSMLNVRIPTHLEEQMKVKLNSSDEFKSISGYIRYLIERDLKI